MRSIKLAIDTNVVLDMLLAREPFVACAKRVFGYCRDKRIQGFITASAVTDIYYLLHKKFHDNEECYRLLGFLLDIVKVLPVTNEDVQEAYLKKARDFEDCLLATCAKNSGCTGIVTRNAADFSESGLKLYTPEECCAMLNDEE